MPFHHVPKVITGAVLDAGPLMIMVILAFGAAAIGMLALRRRDLT